MAKGTTIFETLTRTKTGVILFENFESTTWITDNRWIVIQGNPKNSDDIIYPGTYPQSTYSFKMDASNPRIRKDFAVPIIYISALFYDDPSVVGSNQIPAILVGASGNQWGFGIDTSVSSTFITVWTDGVKSVTTIPRHFGWVLFYIIQDTASNTVKLYVNGLLYSTTTPSVPVTQRLELGCQANPGVPVPMGYIDIVNISSAKDVIVRGLAPGDYFSFRDPVIKNMVSGGTANGSGVATLLNLQPAPIEVYAWNGTPYPYPSTLKLRYMSGNIIDFNSGDEYSYYAVDFGRRVTSLNILRNVKRDDKESNSGVNEALFFNARETTSLAVSDITEDQRRKLVAFWSAIQSGNGYSVAIDSNDKYYAFLRLNANPGDIFVDLAQWDGYGISPGNQLVIKRVDNLYMESVVVDHVVLSLGPLIRVYFKSPLVNSYFAGDVLKSHYYFPKVISTDKSLGISLANLKLKRWTLAHNFKEEL